MSVLTRAAMVCMLVACSRSGDTSASPPDAEFLFASGDSTYWVKSSNEGIRVRSAPILVTEINGRFFEVYIAEDGVDYVDAAFAVARIYARDVLTNDSTLLFDDGSVMRAATSWKREHPDELPIDPLSDDAPDDPTTIVTEEIEILDVHGPWVTFNHLLDMDMADGTPHRHAGRRMVVDVRNGQQGSVRALFGDQEAARVNAAGRQTLRQLLDSIRTAGDDRAMLALESLESFRFDSLSFGITDIGREPAVAFMIPGNGADGEALAINLPPIAIGAPAWWKTVQPTLPEWTRDSSSVHWTRGAYRVVARPDADGEALALALAGKRSGGTEWPVATVPVPAYQLVSLDAPAISTALRDALAKAFDLSATLDGIGQTASRSLSARYMSARRFRAPRI